MNKKKLFIGLLLATFFLYLFLRNINLYQVWNVIQQGSASWLVVAISFNLLNYFVRSVRWRYFFLPIKKTKLWNLYNTTVIGFAVSSIFPARMGEVVRPYLLGQKEQISKSAAFATIVVERLFDTLTILFLLVFYLIFLIDPSQLAPDAQSLLGKLKETGLLIFAVVLLLLLFLYYLKTKPTAMKKLAAKIEKWMPAKMAHSMEGLLDSFIDGLSILHSPKILFQISAWSIFMWLVIAVSFYAAVKAYIPNFAFTSTFLILIILAIGIAIPTPGGVGSFHFACKIGLTKFFGVPDAQAGAIAIVAHAIGFVPITIQGFFHLWHEGLSANKISEIADADDGKN